MAIKMKLYSVVIGCLLAGLCLVTNSVFAHPFHTTTAEMEFNSNTGRFEVSLKIPATDFEHIVSGGATLMKAKQSEIAGNNATLTQNVKVENEQLAATYIEHQFVVNVAGKPCHLEWIGSEDDRASKWLYFELVLPNDSKRSGELTLTNKVLCDRNSGQINTVVVIAKAARVSLKTHEQLTIVSLPRIE